jgi:hypothetical protein
MTRKVPVPVTGASYSPFIFHLFYQFVFHFWGFGVFLFSNYFFNYLSQESAIFIADADPAMSFEELGVLPQAQATH